MIFYFAFFAVIIVLYLLYVGVSEYVFGLYRHYLAQKRVHAQGAS